MDEVGRNNTNSNALRWQAPEYVFQDKRSDWFWALGIIAISGAVTAVLLGNVLFAALIIIGAFTMALYAARKPRIVSFEINGRGVVASSTLYPFQTLEAFWVDEARHEPVLILQSTKTFMPYIVVPLGDIDLDVVRERLGTRLQETELIEPFSVKVMEFFGF